MIRLLVAGVLVVVLGVVISRMSGPSSAPVADPVQAQTQVDQARQDVNDAMSAENQRAAELNNFGSEPANP